MKKTIKEFRVPVWAMCYLVNDDPGELSEEDINTIDKWYSENTFTGYTMFTFEIDQEGYFSDSPAFGLPCDVIDCKAITLQ